MNSPPPITARRRRDLSNGNQNHRFLMQLPSEQDNRSLRFTQNINSYASRNKEKHISKYNSIIKEVFKLCSGGAQTRRVERQFSILALDFSYVRRGSTRHPQSERYGLGHPRCLTFTQVLSNANNAHRYSPEKAPLCWGYSCLRGWGWGKTRLASTPTPGRSVVMLTGLRRRT